MLEDTIDHLTKITNRSRNQTIFLYNLLDKNFTKLMLLEQKLKNTFTFYVPDNKKEIDKILSLKDLSSVLKFNLLDCKPVCRHKDFHQLIGIITRELNMKRCDHCYTLIYKDQWGISWNKESISNWITFEKNGMPYYWNDKDTIEIIFVNK